MQRRNILWKPCRKTATCGWRDQPVLLSLRDMEKHNAGFTLVELMVVMVIVALLSGGVMRGWQAWQQRQHLNDSARQLLLFLLRQQNEAHWQNSERRLWWRNYAQGCIGVGDAIAATCRNGRSQFVPAWQEVRVVRMNGEPGFFGKRDTAWPGSIDIASPAGQWRAVISARGRVRLCQPDAEGCQ